MNGMDFIADGTLDVDRAWNAAASAATLDVRTEDAVFDSASYGFPLGESASDHLNTKLKSRGWDFPCCGSCAEGGACEGGCGGCVGGCARGGSQNVLPRGGGAPLGESRYGGGEMCCDGSPLSTGCYCPDRSPQNPPGSSVCCDYEYEPDCGKCWVGLICREAVEIPRIPVLWGFGIGGKKLYHCALGVTECGAEEPTGIGDYWVVFDATLSAVGEKKPIDPGQSSRWLHRIQKGTATHQGLMHLCDPRQPNGRECKVEWSMSKDCPMVIHDRTFDYDCENTCHDEIWDWIREYVKCVDDLIAGPPILDPKNPPDPDDPDNPYNPHDPSDPWPERPNYGPTRTSNTWIWDLVGDKSDWFKNAAGKKPPLSQGRTPGKPPPKPRWRRC